SISMLFIGCPPVNCGAIMTDKSSRVYVILGNAQWNFADCQTALSRVPARMISLPAFETEDEMIARTRDADALVVSSAPVPHGEIVGIVGLGNIGSAFARRVAALETKVIACDPYVDDQRFAALGVERVTLETLAERADYVSVHTLLNAETRHLIGEAFFGRMKPTAILIHTSRGPVVDEQALARALRGKRLAGAALDVWAYEPVGRVHPLFKVDIVLAIL